VVVCWGVWFVGGFGWGGAGCSGLRTLVPDTAGVRARRGARGGGWVRNREYRVGGDIQAVLPSVVGHRVRGRGHSQDTEPLVKHLRDSVNVLG
jgi:hypothetical protein